MLTLWKNIPRVAFKQCCRSYSPRARFPIRRANLADEPFPLTQQLRNVLDEPVLVIERQLEIGSVIMGFEQSRIFRVYRPDGTPLGHLEEVGYGIGTAIMRQITRLHRPFTVRLFGNSGDHLLTVKRPFSIINSQIKCFTPDDTLIGESQQEWHLWRRRYNLFLSNPQQNSMEFNQFGRIDAPFLSFQFPVENEQHQVLGSIDRNWTGISREIFTDTGVYFLRFSADRITESLLDQSLPISHRPLSLAERIVMLGTAISVDFDYFSRHSNRGTGPMMFFPGDEI